MVRLAGIQHAGQSSLLSRCDGETVHGLDLDPDLGVGAVVGGYFKLAISFLANLVLLSLILTLIMAKSLLCWVLGNSGLLSRIALLPREERRRNFLLNAECCEEGVK